MKTCRVFHVVDTVSKQLVSTFLSPTLAYAQRQFVQMVDGTKGVLPDDFELCEGNDVEIFETYSEVENAGLVTFSYMECKDES